MSVSSLIERQKEKLVLGKNIICFSQHDLFVFKTEPFVLFILALLKSGGRGYSGSRIYIQVHSGVLKSFTRELLW